MTPLTIVMAYYENEGMLAYHYNLWRQLPAKLRDLLHVVVVDDGSPSAPAIHPVGMHDWSLQIYRMDVDVRWNQDACRNVGVAHAETNWVLITDIDHIVPEGTLDRVCMRKWDDGAVYKFGRVSMPDLEPYKQHPNTWLMTRKMYNEAGGYDERFAGYYGTDGDFRDRVLALAELKQIKEPIIRVPRTFIADASTTTYLRKQPEDSVAIREIKERRAQEEDPSPKRGLFKYHRVYP